MAQYDDLTYLLQPAPSTAMHEYDSLFGTPKPKDHEPSRGAFALPFVYVTCNDTNAPFPMVDDRMSTNFHGTMEADIAFTLPEWNEAVEDDGHQPMLRAATVLNGIDYPNKVVKFIGVCPYRESQREQGAGAIPNYTVTGEVEMFNYLDKPWAEGTILVADVPNLDYTNPRYSKLRITPIWRPEIDHIENYFNPAYLARPSSIPNTNIRNAITFYGIDKIAARVEAEYAAGGVTPNTFDEFMQASKLLRKISSSMLRARVVKITPGRSFGRGIIQP